MIKKREFLKWVDIELCEDCKTNKTAMAAIQNSMGKVVTFRTCEKHWRMIKEDERTNQYDKK